MTDVSVIIPARNEQFLTKTINDIVAKSRVDTEVIAVLEGYWPEEIVDHPKVNYIHFTNPRGMRGALNAGVAIAKGKYVMKLDGHCMVAEGFDKVLSETCRPNWVCVPTRHRLDPENWEINNGGRPPINYLYMDPTNDGVNFKEWRQKNKDRSLDEIQIDDILSCQGSCYFMAREFWYELELLDEENYGTFRKDPQEVCFKALTYGGRAVRVKGTWYAHLHKGKKYGRGYGTSSEDWAKGDEYVKRWFTDDAWDKQKIPFREVLSRFSDMPGWKDHEWMQKKQESYKHLPNLYQYLEVNGEPFSRPRPDRANSKFWNEGKWETFVEPLLPEEPKDQTFIEMGADSGLFLKLATDYGFPRVIGIEKNRTPVKYGLLYRDTVGYDYKLLKRKLGGSFGEDGTFNIDELPVADVTLMSTFHYYIDINSWLKYIDRLKSKSCCVIIVSRPTPLGRHWVADCDYASVRRYFADWDVTGYIHDVPMSGDPKPRDLYSVSFQSPTIKRIPIASIDIRESEDDPMHKAMVDLAQRVASGEEFDPFSTAYYHRWRERKAKKWSEGTTRRFVQMKTDVMRGVMEDGLMDPIVVTKDGLRLCDGGHRLVMLRVLGYESAIVRET